MTTDISCPHCGETIKYDDICETYASRQSMATECFQVWCCSCENDVDVYGDVKIEFRLVGDA